MLIFDACWWFPGPIQIFGRRLSYLVWYVRSSNIAPHERGQTEHGHSVFGESL